MLTIYALFAQDDRLRFDDQDLYHLSLPYNLKDRLWTPDFHVDNAAAFELTPAVDDNGIIDVYRNGDIYTSIGVTIRTYCSLDVSRFPFDEQT